MSIKHRARRILTGSAVGAMIGLAAGCGEGPTPPVLEELVAEWNTMPVNIPSSEVDVSNDTVFVYHDEEDIEFRANQAALISNGERRAPDLITASFDGNDLDVEGDLDENVRVNIPPSLITENPTPLALNVTYGNRNARNIIYFISCLTRDVEINLDEPSGVVPANQDLAYSGTTREVPLSPRCNRVRPVDEVVFSYNGFTETHNNVTNFNGVIPAASVVAGDYQAVADATENKLFRTLTDSDSNDVSVVESPTITQTLTRVNGIDLHLVTNITNATTTNSIVTNVTINDTIYNGPAPTDTIFSSNMEGIYEVKTTATGSPEVSDIVQATIPEIDPDVPDVSGIVTDVSVGQETTVTLPGLTDPNIGDVPMYTTATSSNGNATVSLSGNDLTITGVSQGVTDVSVNYGDATTGTGTVNLPQGNVSGITRNLSGEVIGFFEEGVGGRNSARPDSTGTRMANAKVYVGNTSGTVTDSTNADAFGNYSLTITDGSTNVLFVPGNGEQNFLEKGIVVTPGTSDLTLSPIVYQASDNMDEYLHESLFRDVVLSLDDAISDPRQASDLTTRVGIPDGIWTGYMSSTLPTTYNVAAGFDPQLLNQVADSLETVFNPATLGLVDFTTILVHDPNIDETQFTNPKLVKTSDPFPTFTGIDQYWLRASPGSAPASGNFYDLSNAGYALTFGDQTIPQSLPLANQLEFLMTEIYASLLGGPEGSSVSPMLSSSGVSPNGPEWRVLEVVSHRAGQAGTTFSVTWPDYTIDFVDPRN